MYPYLRNGTGRRSALWHQGNRLKHWAPDQNKNGHEFHGFFHGFRGTRLRATLFAIVRPPS